MVLVLGGWELLARAKVYPPHLLPPPSAVADALAGMAANGELWLDLKATGRRWLLGLLIGNVIGVLLGALTGALRGARSSVGLVMNGLRGIPFLIMIPVAMLWLGLGEVEKVALAAWGAAFPVWLNTQSGFLGVEREYVWAARCLGASGWRLFWEVHLRRCLPFVVSGTRNSLATATFALAAAEMSGAFEGLGFRVFYTYQMFQTDKMVAGIVLITLLTIAADRLFVLASRRAMPWTGGEPS